MFTLIVLAIYTVLVLLFVPLNKISAWQSAVKKWAKRVTDKIGD